MTAKQLLVILLAFLLLGLCACGTKAPAIQSSVAVSTAAGESAIPSAGRSETAVNATDDSAPAQSAVAISTDAEALTADDGTVSLQDFGNAFRLLPENPLDEILSQALYLEAQAPEDTSGSGSQQSMKGLLDKYNALVNGPGLHYTDSSYAMGFDMKAEHWVKNGKFKKIDSALNRVAIFDGSYYYEYDLESKTGKKLASGEPGVAANLKNEMDSVLSSLVLTTVEEKPEEKVGAFDCQVFYRDVELLGMKGNTVYVDKATGVTVKNVFGDPKDKKKSVVTEALTVDTAGFGDDVFAVPADITFE